MLFTIDFLDDGRVLEWEVTGDGAVAIERDNYTPRFFVAPRSPGARVDLSELRMLYERHPDGVATELLS